MNLASKDGTKGRGDEGTKGMLPAVSVLGFGAVTAVGRDVQSLAILLAKPPTKPPGSPRRVTDELLGFAGASRLLRRAGRFPRMAVLAAMDAWEAAGGRPRGLKPAARGSGEGQADGSGEDVAMDRVGLIVATGLGPHDRTFKFLDGILDCGDSSASPTDFSHSVHNAAAAYITEILGWRGRSCTVTDFAAGFEQAVLLAQVWLAEDACDRVVVGAVEELGDVLLSLAPRMVGNISSSADVAVGEGACFLTLGRDALIRAPSASAGLSTSPSLPVGETGLALLSAMAQRDAVDIVVMDDPTLPSHVDQTASPTVRARQAVTFSPYFGHMATSSAFQTLGGLLCLQTGRALGKTLPSADGVHLVETSISSPSVDSVRVYNRSSLGESLSLLLTRPGI